MSSHAPVSPGHASAFRTAVGAALPRPCAHFYTHLVERETLNHDSFLRILPDGHRALGLQQVVNLFVVHLVQGTQCKAEVWFPGSEQGEELCTPGSHTTRCPPQHHLWDLVTPRAADGALNAEDSLGGLYWQVTAPPLLQSQEALSAVWTMARKRKFPDSRWEKPAAPVHQTGWVSLLPAGL